MLLAWFGKQAHPKQLEPLQVVAMLRIVVVANLLLTAVAVGDLAFWIKKASDGKSSVACKDICTNVYGTGSWGEPVEARGRHMHMQRKNRGSN